jgi:hypothetical protein
MPAACRGLAAEQLAAFLAQSRFDGPVIDYRPVIGEFGAASAVAAVLAVEMIGRNTVPAAWAGGTEIALNGKGVLLLGLGPQFSAVRIALP